MSTAEGNISTLQQTTSSISAIVSNKADKTGGSQSTFGWSLTSSGFYLYSGNSTVLAATSSGIAVYGHIEANSGTLGTLSIVGRLSFGNNDSYYIDPNYEDSSYYINLPGFRVDDGSGAVFSGRLSAPSGTIGGFTIATSSIYNGKTSYSSTAADGVYLGTDGIGLGKGVFYVTKAGYLYATNVSVTGSITSTSGTIGGFTIASTKLYKNKNHLQQFHGGCLSRNRRYRTWGGFVLCNFSRISVCYERKYQRYSQCQFRNPFRTAGHRAAVFR